MSTVDKARERIQAFAREHRLVFEDHGEVGFGRPCVGLMHGDQYVAYRPTRYVFDSPWDINISDIVRVEGFQDDRVCPPDSVTDAYHKHDCLAVLVHDDSYDTAILQLADWVARLEQVGVEIAPYQTGAQGVHALVHGLIGYAVRPAASQPEEP